MANLYLSFLGTNDYIPCTYLYKTEQVPGVRFVQEATLRLFCRDWKKEDRLVIFLTEEARKRNWVDDGHVDRQTGEAKDRKGLHRCIEALNLGASLETVDIPSGKNEEEIWEIFDRVFEVIRQEDRIVFDITHAFRSIPTFAVVILAYAKILKKAELKGLYYGAFEVLGPASEVKEMDEKDRLTPIFDLTPYAVLMDFAQAIDRFVESGEAGSISELMQERMKPILKETQGRNSSAADLRKIATDMEKLSLVMSTCRGRQITETVRSLKNDLEKLQDTDLMRPVRPLLGRLDGQLSGFTGETLVDGVQAVRWCLNHNLIQQAYTILEENLLTYLLLQVGKKPFEPMPRQVAGQALKIALQEIPRRQWISPACDEAELTQQIATVVREKKDVLKEMGKLIERRNDLNHAGMIAGPVSDPRKFRKEIESLLTRFQCLLDQQ